jgi:hypothetical protein
VTTTSLAEGMSAVWHLLTFIAHFARLRTASLTSLLLTFMLPQALLLPVWLLSWLLH